MTTTVTIYTETLREAILDGPLDSDDLAIVDEHFDNYLEYIAKTQSKRGLDVEFKHGQGVYSWLCEDDECAMVGIKDFWEWV